MLNLRSEGLVLDTSPDGRVAGRAPGRWIRQRMENSASTDSTGTGFAWVCQRLAIRGGKLKSDTVDKKLN